MNRREQWRRCVENHADDDSHAICDACLYLSEVYARMEALEEVLSDLAFAAGEFADSQRSISGNLGGRLSDAGTILGDKSRTDAP